jgi:hypothetical protein
VDRMCGRSGSCSDVKMKLNYWKKSWPLRTPTCPCDADFVEYIAEKKMGNKVIFHFGTGSHHLVGKTNASLAKPNLVFGITASRREYGKYVDYIINNPLASGIYQVIFADVYTLQARLLPRFDYVTLFHLGEFYDEKLSAYAPLTDSTLVDLFLTRLNRNGRIFFYKFSAFGGAERTRVILRRAVRQGKIAKVEEYKSLMVYRRGSESSLADRNSVPPARVAKPSPASRATSSSDSSPNDLPPRPSTARSRV